MNVDDGDKDPEVFVDGTVTEGSDDAVTEDVSEAAVTVSKNITIP